MAAKHKSIETKWYEKRDRLMHEVRRLDRRDFFKVMAAAGTVTAAKRLTPPHSFQLVEVLADSPKPEKFSFAYVSDTHLYSPKLNDQFIKSAIRAVEDVNRLDPQPDFVLFGGDLAQLGAKEELEIGKQILKDLKAPVHMMVGEHDWFLDMGENWRQNFGKPTYSFDHKGRPLRGADERQRERFLDARGTHAGRANAHCRRVRQWPAIEIRSRRRAAAMAHK